MNPAFPPLLGFCARSGTGKTTLLRRLLPLLRQEGLRVGVVKHAHHSFDIDLPGKDSYELRAAGAEQILVASRERVALIREIDSAREPALEEMLSCLDTRNLDLVLVEGYKQSPIPKIELHRGELGQPLLHPHTPNVVALATDRPLAVDLPQLDLDDPGEIMTFILAFIADARSSIHADTPHPYRSQLR
jgi:molybdopterin-guanine dinucleotide biosynthesis protein MobB